MNNSFKIKFFVAILLSYFHVCQLKSIEIITNPLIDKHYSFLNAEMYNDEIFIIGVRDIENNYTQTVMGFIKYTSNGEVFELPSTYLENGEEKKIYTAHSCLFTVNSKGDFFLTGKGCLFKFSENKWEKIQIDSLDVIRKITGMSFDIYDNLWLTTSIKDYDNGLLKSEVFKYSDNKFNLLLTTDDANSFYSALYSSNSKNIVGLKDGRVAIHRQWFGDIEKGDRAKYKSHDLWIFDQNGEFETDLIIQSAGMPDYKEQGFENPYQKNKNVTYMYEKDNYLYVALRPLTYKGLFDGTYYNSWCCGGFTKVDKNGNWMPYKEEDGLPIIYVDKSYEDYNPVTAISELNDGTLIFIGLNGIYYINENDKINWINPEIINENSKLIIIESIYNNKDLFNANFGDFLQFDIENQGLKWDPNSPGFSKIFKKSNSDFVLYYQNGILIINEKSLTINAVNELSAGIAIVYPNPSSDFISIRNISNNFKYEIIDLLGNIVSFGNYNHKINISNLTYGQYYLRILNENDSKLLKFIKK